MPVAVRQCAPVRPSFFIKKRRSVFSRAPIKKLSLAESFFVGINGGARNSTRKFENKLLKQQGYVINTVGI